MDKSTIHKLSDELGAQWNEEKDMLTLYQDLNAYTPQKITVLTGDELWELMGYWLDGFCTCGEEIPTDHVTCRSCAEQAARAWGIIR